MAHSIRLFTITLKRLNLEPPNLVTYSFYLSITFWQNFDEINSQGVAAAVFDMRISKN